MSARLCLPRSSVRPEQSTGTGPGSGPVPRTYQPCAWHTQTALKIAAVLPICATLTVACKPSTNTAGSGGPRMKWTHADRAGGDALPHAHSAIAVFTTAFDRRVVALDARSGAPRWERRLDAGPAGANLPGRSLLAYQDLILVPGWNLYALDRASGQIRWRYSPPAEYPATASIALSGDRVFSPGARHLHAVDARTGTAVWTAALGERPFDPIVGGGVVYVGTRGFVGATAALGAGHVLAIEASSGRILWRTRSWTSRGHRGSVESARPARLPLTSSWLLRVTAASMDSITEPAMFDGRIVAPHHTSPVWRSWTASPSLRVRPARSWVWMPPPAYFGGVPRPGGVLSASRSRPTAAAPLSPWAASCVWMLRARSGGTTERAHEVDRPTSLPCAPPATGSSSGVPAVFTLLSYRVEMVGG